METTIIIIVYSVGVTITWFLSAWFGWCEFNSEFNRKNTPAEQAFFGLLFSLFWVVVLPFTLLALTFCVMGQGVTAIQEKKKVFESSQKNNKNKDKTGRLSQL